VFKTGRIFLVDTELPTWAYAVIGLMSLVLFFAMAALTIRQVVRFFSGGEQQNVGQKAGEWVFGVPRGFLRMLVASLGFILASTVLAPLSRGLSPDAPGWLAALLSFVADSADTAASLDPASEVVENVAFMLLGPAMILEVRLTRARDQTIHGGSPIQAQVGEMRRALACLGVGMWLAVCVLVVEWASRWFGASQVGNIGVLAFIALQVAVGAIVMYRTMNAEAKPSADQTISTGMARSGVLIGLGQAVAWIAWTGLFCVLGLGTTGRFDPATVIGDLGFWAVLTLVMLLNIVLVALHWLPTLRAAVSISATV
jgi:hypothetical protein